MKKKKYKEQAKYGKQNQKERKNTEIRKKNK